MTNDYDETVQPTSMDYGSVQFGIPGLPYSAVRVPLDINFAWVMERLTVFAEAYGRRFPPDAAPPPQEYPPHDDAPPREDHAPQQQGGAPANPGGAPTKQGGQQPRQERQPQGPQKPSGLFCPEHPSVQLVQSKPLYQKYDTDPETGADIPAAYFCPGQANGTGSNHSVWRRNALVAEDVQ
jgi:hypothetical protein